MKITNKQPSGIPTSGLDRGDDSQLKADPATPDQGQFRGRQTAPESAKWQHIASHMFCASDAPRAVTLPVPQAHNLPRTLILVWHNVPHKAKV